MEERRGNQGDKAAGPPALHIRRCQQQELHKATWSGGEMEEEEEEEEE